MNTGTGKNSKDVRNKRPSGIRIHHSSLNTGTVLFGILFLYILICIIIFVTTKHVNSYQVTSGPLAKNETYTGIALYNEQVIKADAGGFITYYAQNNSKIRRGGIVYGLSSERKVMSTLIPSDETLSRIRREMEAFTRLYSSDNYNEVYSLKHSIAGELLNQSISGSALAGTTGSKSIGNETINTSPGDGILCYTIDGYEGIDYKKLPEYAFDEKAYQIRFLKTDERVEAGEPLYRLIESEDWSLIIPLTQKQTIRLGDISRIRVRFLQDGATSNADLSIFTDENGGYYAKLDFSEGLLRYLGSRFIDVELVTNSEVGLKIPISSIVSKQFYTIPDEYAANGGNSKEIGFFLQEKDKGGNITGRRFVTTTLYEHLDGLYYVDDTDFKAGDVILKDGSNTDRYIVSATRTLEGVYSMNKGYAVFRKISIIDKNEEYCLVHKGIKYGISQFDNIVADSTTVKESQITAK